MLEQKKKEVPKILVVVTFKTMEVLMQNWQKSKIEIERK